MGSLALLAAGEARRPLAVAMLGGHGELFVQAFGEGGKAGEVRNLTPEDAALEIDAPLVIGSGAVALVAARGSGEARDGLPSARNALAIAPALRTLPPRPVYARAPDAKAMAAA